MPLPDWLPLEVRTKGRITRVEAGECLFELGSRPKAMYLVLSGEVHLVRHTKAGGRVVLQRSRGGFVAEASLDQANYHCDAVAMARSEVLAIALVAFKGALEDAAFRNRWIAHLARELRRSRAQNERRSLRTAEERIVHYIECEGAGGAMELAGTRKDLAVELGLTHEALYRALARMVAKGQVEIEGRCLRLA